MNLLRLLLVLSLVGFDSFVNAQSSKSPVSRVINVPSTSQISPSLSGDGRHMIFTSTSNLKSELLLFYSFQQKPGKWTQPEPVTTINRSLPINHIGGYSLSYDGNYIFFTSRKSYGIGKFDIWYSKRTGNNQWSAPINMAKPINSTMDEGCPSISPDGKTIYFVRCESMDLKEGNGCKLMMAQKKSKDFWEKPVSLPSYINDGNIMSPKILADNQTLIYAKGQGDSWDLYQTRLELGTWTKPVALDFVNSAGDERFASVPARGDVMYYSTKFQGTYDIIKAKIPEAYQPQKVLYLKGKVTSQESVPMEAFIQIYDVENKDLVQYQRTSKENSDFEFYLAAGKQYDFSIVPLASKYSFYSELIDLSNLEVSNRRKMEVALQPLETGSSFPLNCLSFENDSTLNSVSRFEMSRLIKLLKKNPGTQVQIAVHRDKTDIDSTLFLNDMLMVHDSSMSEEPLVAESSLYPVDSLEIPQDSVMLPVIDPTEVQAQTISQYLQERGVPEYLLEAKGFADTEMLFIDGSEEERKLNQRVEIRVL